MQEKIRGLLVEPNKLPKVIEFKNNLEEKQKLVNGNIEYAYLNESNDVVLICNEEGKILGLPYNRDIGYDIIAGNFLIVGDDAEIGEDISLTDNQIEKYSKLFDEKSIVNTNNKVNNILLNNMKDQIEI